MTEHAADLDELARELDRLNPRSDAARRAVDIAREAIRDARLARIVMLKLLGDLGEMEAVNAVLHAELQRRAGEVVLN